MNCVPQDLYHYKRSMPTIAGGFAGDEY